MLNRNHAATAVSFQLILIVAAVLALMGYALVIFGCAFEAQGQLDLLRASGPAALDAYLAHVGSHQLSLAALMFESVAGHGYAYGAFLQGVGFGFVFFIAPLSAALLIAVRWFAVRGQGTNLRHRIAAVH
ncbi:hypothetical protein R75461_08168 [Paraburkholderia nemoris]|uniref:hypothetical protein n=1 Tax=Paraburkholderia nemoris TaxID=2793076 RepID=UPI00190964DA|nr:MULTISPECIES: hypothetical protein [Paraburkholderia]MBK3786888.1 hypothetical protein [Paraburkholderia aspalathi]CAE6864302.1 hypothetical protein R75461_08168 [Paraburkholderia nemoris]